METGQKLCHRCSNLLPEDALFCTQCGAPQLVLNSADAQRIAEERATANSGAVPVRQMPPPGPGRIRWRPVVHIVALIALAIGATAVLANVVPVLGMVAFFMALMAPMLCIRSYQRRLPGAPMTARAGARVGLLLGLFLSVAMIGASTGGLLVSRYTLHHGAEMDKQFTDELAQGQQSMQKMMDGRSPEMVAQWQQVTQFYMQYYQTPDGRATMMLGNAAWRTLEIVVYCVLSGLFLGWLRPLTRRQAV